jgi:hypothetical protein
MKRKHILVACNRGFSANTIKRDSKQTPLKTKAEMSIKVNIACHTLGAPNTIEIKIKREECCIVIHADDFIVVENLTARDPHRTQSIWTPGSTLSNLVAPQIAVL